MIDDDDPFDPDTDLWEHVPRWMRTVLVACAIVAVVILGYAIGMVGHR